MKILLKDFDKLKQLDRVEYLLRLERIEKKYNWGASLWIIFIISAYAAFTLLISITSYNAFGINFLIKILNKFYFILKIFGVCLGMSIVLDIYMIMRGGKYKRELYNQFFKTEPKDELKRLFKMRDIIKKKK